VAGSELLFTHRPSLDYAFFALTGQWLVPNQMIRCPFPGHDDSTPSFNLFDAGDEGSPRLWACFGCGKRGDVVHLIHEMTGIAGPALVRKAEAMADEELASSGHDRPAPKQREILDFGETLAEVAAGITDVRIRGFDRYMLAKGLTDAREFAWRELGWAPGPYGTVVVPHWSSAENLTGIKYRTLNRKWSADGSSWPALYGAWRDRGSGTVVLCEGESDCLWAAWSLREYAVDVLALPSGASAAVTDDWIKVVAGRRLFLLFDADNAGRKASGQWLAVRPDAFVGDLPEGEDLLSSGIPVLEVLQRASKEGNAK
jgi:hypothetical protein